MKTIENYSLLNNNTFGVDVNARYFIEYDSVEELQYLLRSDLLQENKFFHIGGGSNLLFINDYEGVILHSKITGIDAYLSPEMKSTGEVLGVSEEQLLKYLNLIPSSSNWTSSIESPFN